MNANISQALVLACLCIGFDAMAGEQNQIEQIAQEAGASTRQVRMVVGNRTPFAGYRNNYDRIERRVHEAMDRLDAEYLAKQNSKQGDALLAASGTSAAKPSPNAPH
jgi:hypothetical protein